ncbi:hypothetical protein [Salinilacihabitans rarus]|uniref:hypothetical protein n=1 Tax=Salinilacihabitans rarus TaxID=2961596 RepID=UPI0020C91646|nr:hypothetical protein [Salinilacihabitans rarus]
MGRVTEGDRRFDPARVAERLCYLFPPVVGVGAVGVLREVDPAVPLLGWTLVLVGSFGYALLTLGMTVALFLDARQVRETGQWLPIPWLEAAFAFLWAPAAGVFYLYRRHRRFGTPAGRSEWWLVVALSLAASVLGLAAAAVGYVLAIPGLVTTAAGVAGAIAVGAFPVSIHRDAAYVSTRRASWRPNPAAYLGAAFVSLFVPVVQPALAAYYLAKRRRTLGTP